jgi:hypothetical protein
MPRNRTSSDTRPILQENESYNNGTETMIQGINHNCLKRKYTFFLFFNVLVVDFPSDA